MENVKVFGRATKSMKNLTVRTARIENVSRIVSAEYRSNF